MKLLVKKITKKEIAGYVGVVLSALVYMAQNTAAIERVTGPLPHWIKTLTYAACIVTAWLAHPPVVHLNDNDADAA